jgi:hypothetical protein
VISRLNFWQNSLGWTQDPDGYVFLGRAVAKVGNAMFPERWTGYEPLLLKQQIPFGIQATKALDAIFKGPPEDPVPEYDYTEYYDEPSLQRFREVQSKIATWAEAGLLSTTWREKAGNDQHSIPRNWWTIEPLQQRFDFCQIDPNDPFGADCTSDGHCWIFVTFESLRKCVSLLSREQKSALDEPKDHTVADMPLPRLSKKEAEQLYLERVKSFEGQTPPSRAQDEAYLKSFNIGRLRARELRDQYAPSSWAKAGPRSKQTPK